MTFILISTINMAPIIDSQYTDPEALRLLYRNPRNQTGAILSEGPVQTVTSPTFEPVILPPPTHCPAVGQFTIIRVPNSKHGIMPMLVQLVQRHIDHLWNPITSTFQAVTLARRVKHVPCVKITTTDGAESIVSISDMVIRTLEDDTGRSVAELIAEHDVEHRIVSCIKYRAGESYIATIEDMGEQDVIEFSLEDNGIYASGSLPDRMTVRHNKEVNPPDEPPVIVT